MFDFIAANRQGSAEPTTIPAPIGGWNARDALDLMAPTDAIVLDNFYPSETEVFIRRGFASHATGLGDPIKTLLSYDGRGTKKMFGCAGGNIFETTSSGAVGAADQSGLSDDEWEGVNLGTSGGHFLWICNGSDAERYYNGTDWTNAGLSGVSAGDVSNVFLHKTRLFVIIKNTLQFGYLGTNAVSGSVSKFDLASLFSEGGTLVAGMGWSRDGGAGPDDYAAFVTTNGQVAVYAGTDPSSSTTWSIVGVYKISRPLGKRCMFKVGSDVIVITESGYLPLSRVLPTGESAPNSAISDKVSGAVKNRARSFSSQFGWQGLVYPMGGYGLFNVPTSSAGDFEQHIVNLNTGAWCRFTGQNAHSWVVHDGSLYFGGDGTVYQADTGLSDAGATINADGKTAFQYFNARGRFKSFTIARPVLTAEGDLPVSFGFDTDFSDNPVSYTPSTVTSGGSEWDVAAWDDAPWAADSIPVQDWRTVGVLGDCIAFRLRTQTSAQTASWRATDVKWVLLRGI